MTLFLHEKHELLHLVVNSIRKDLLENNELFNCLALHAIANVGGKEMGEALSGEVHRLLIAPYVVLVAHPSPRFRPFIFHIGSEKSTMQSSVLLMLCP